MPLILLKCKRLLDKSVSIIGVGPCTVYANLSPCLLMALFQRTLSQILQSIIHEIQILKPRFIIHQEEDHRVKNEFLITHPVKKRGSFLWPSPHALWLRTPEKRREGGFNRPPHTLKKRPGRDERGSRRDFRRWAGAPRQDIARRVEIIICGPSGCRCQGRSCSLPSPGICHTCRKIPPPKVLTHSLARSPFVTSRYTRVVSPQPPPTFF